MCTQPIGAPQEQRRKTCICSRCCNQVLQTGFLRPPKHVLKDTDTRTHLLLAASQPQTGHLAGQRTHGGEAVGTLCKARKASGLELQVNRRSMQLCACHAQNATDEWKGRASITYAAEALARTLPAQQTRPSPAQAYWLACNGPDISAWGAARTGPRGDRDRGYCSGLGALGAAKFAGATGNPAAAWQGM